MTNLTRLTTDMNGLPSYSYGPLSVIAGLTKLRVLRIPQLLDPSSFSTLRWDTAKRNHLRPVLRLQAIQGTHAEMRTRVSQLLDCAWPRRPWFRSAKWRGR
jgi:hypothetical protein